MINKKKKIVIGTFVVLAICFVAFYFAFIFPMNKEYKAVRTMNIEEPDLTRMSDGAYIGEFTYGSTLTKVEVQITAQKIVNIKVLQAGKNEHALKARAVLEEVIAKQSLQVDTVAGATTTSKALLKAIERALKQEM